MNESTQLERLQKWAMHYHSAIITPGQDGDVRFVEAATYQRLSRQFAIQLQIALQRHDAELQILELELSKFLRTESAHPILQDVSKFLHRRTEDLQLHDIRTEVLASWLAEIETSDSSSGCADGESTGEQS